MDTSLVGAAKQRWVRVCLFVKQGFMGTVCLANGVGGQHGALSGEQLISRSRWEHGERVSGIQLNQPGTCRFPSAQSEAPSWYLPSLFSVHPANRWHLQPLTDSPSFSATLPFTMATACVKWLLSPEGSSQKQNLSSSGSFNVHVPHCRCCRWTIGLWGGPSLRWNWDFRAIREDVGAQRLNLCSSTWPWWTFFFYISGRQDLVAPVLSFTIVPVNKMNCTQYLKSSRIRFSTLNHRILLSCDHHSPNSLFEEIQYF